MFKQYATELVVNDFEDYGRAVSECDLTNRSTVSMAALAAKVDEINRVVADARMPPGFFRALYAPRDPENICADDRVFYTPENAYRLDAYRQLLEGEPGKVQKLLMGPLLSAASVHANTAGVFNSRASTRTGERASASSGAAALMRSRGSRHRSD